MNRWDQPGIPHKGWTYIGVEDLGEEARSEDEIDYEQCEMCGQEKIRYVHILSHPDFQGEIRVGCICAAKLTENYVAPKSKERQLRNKANRRKNFLRQEWRRIKKGYTLRYKGENITILMSRYASWGAVVNGQWRWSYRGERIRDKETAKLVAFDLLEEQHEVNSYEYDEETFEEPEYEIIEED